MSNQLKLTQAEREQIAAIIIERVKYISSSQSRDESGWISARSLNEIKALKTLAERVCPALFGGNRMTKQEHSNEQFEQILEKFEDAVSAYTGYIQRGGSPMDSGAKQSSKLMSKLRAKLIDMFESARAISAESQKIAQNEPVAGQCRWKREVDWRNCSIEHVQFAMKEPRYAADGYEVRYLYAAPVGQAAPIPPNSSELQAAPVELPEPDIYTNGNWSLTARAYKEARKSEPDAFSDMQGAYTEEAVRQLLADQAKE